MVVRFYSSTAQETALTANITNVSTSMVVASTSGFPTSTPFSLAIDYQTASEELVTVTNVSGTTLTVARGFDGTAATSHNTGAKVRHVSSAFDFASSRSHENASVDIHGLAAGAAIVGTNTTQTLTNKTINGAVFDNITTSAWTTFAPSWTAGSPVTLGNGLLQAKYARVGKTVHYKITVIRGTTTTIPNLSAGWTFSLPFQPQKADSGEMPSGTIMINSGLGVNPGWCFIDGVPAPYELVYVIPNLSANSYENVNGNNTPANVITHSTITYESL